MSDYPKWKSFLWQLIFLYMAANAIYVIFFKEHQPKQRQSRQLSGYQQLVIDAKTYCHDELGGEFGENYDCQAKMIDKWSSE